MEDTICAISTSLGGAISIVRVSGKNAIKIVNKFFSTKNLETAKSHTIHYGYIVNETQKIDEVLVSVFKAPKTYTCEDIVEINCHGGISTTNKVLELLLTNGCRLAEGGEFTKRAFLNGRIDLIQAEAVSDLLSSTSDQARSLSLNQVKGDLSLKIKNIRNTILDLLANIAVNIDYPEYEDAEEVTIEILQSKIPNIINQLNNLLNTASSGQIIKNGINVSIVGRPNVGKSSLLNKLLQEDKAIVTDIAGTTRDIVEGSISLNGIRFNFTDTAGIRDTKDKVEKIGVNKSKQYLKSSDYIICVLNGTEQLTKDDQEILDALDNDKSIIFVNKNDQKLKIDVDKKNIIYGNTIDANGIDELKNKLIENFNLDKINSNDITYLSNARQISLVKQAKNTLEKVNDSLNELIPIDMLEIDIKKSYDLLGEITGETYQDELLDKLFENFCLGK
ncbi:MAG TPA: tRNA uridine-5-carboxymethylaminomethyl(34) synthesis GTPase MnmE [Bacilli bacterium]|nr:tRNA uridine-5-carboxymethylaminomethyl(34) synthesis GTPase MnmE [Bacilli bacterium]